MQNEQILIKPTGPKKKGKRKTNKNDLCVVCDCACDAHVFVTNRQTAIKKLPALNHFVREKRVKHKKKKRKRTTEPHSNKMASDNPANRSCDRRPMTRKEIKFFGTAISFDEPSTKQNNSIKCASPKFFRTQSFGVLTPRMSRNKRFLSSRSCSSGYNRDDDTTDDNGAASAGGSIVQRDNNFNYNTLDCVTKTIITLPDKLCNSNVGTALSTSKLDMVDEDSENPSAGNNEILMNRRRIRYVQQQSLQSTSTTRRSSRLTRLRMHQFRSRSASCDGWDNQMNTRYGATFTLDSIIY